MISTAVWLSAAVEKIWLFFVGIVVFLSISLVAIPPIVSIESESGVTSRRRINDLTLSCTAGILVEPPTNNTFESSEAVRPASESAFLTGSAVFSTRSCVNSSNLALVRVISKCFGPSAVAVM